MVTQPVPSPDDFRRLPIGVVLAGGRGLRFGGTDKSFLDLNGRPLLAHVVDRIAPQVGELVLNTNSDDRRYRAYGLSLCADNLHPAPATGPLVGLTSVIEALRGRGDMQSSLLSVPVDTPFLPRDLAHRLASALGATDASIAYAATAERDHPIVALWRPQSRDPVRRLFDRQPTISLHGLMATLHAERVTFAHTPHDPFFNVNRIEDLATADRIAASTGGF